MQSEGFEPYDWSRPAPLDSAPMETLAGGSDPGGRPQVVDDAGAAAVRGAAARLQGQPAPGSRLVQQPLVVREHLTQHTGPLAH